MRLGGLRVGGLGSLHPTKSRLLCRMSLTALAGTDELDEPWILLSQRVQVPK